MYYIYVLQSKLDLKLYIGLTKNLSQRIKKHNSGDVKSTSKRRPFILVYYECLANKKDAYAREKYLKSGYGHEQLYNIFKNTLQ